MAPQKRGVVPPEHADRILDAQRAAGDADEAYKTAVADALKAGASVREIAALTGLSRNTVDQWGQARGWPTPEQKAERAAARVRNAAWDDRMGGIDPR